VIQAAVIAGPLSAGGGDLTNSRCNVSATPVLHNCVEEEPEMTRLISESTWSLLTMIGGNTIPPRDPNDDDEDNEEDNEHEEEDEEPPVVREPDE
jgi:hypothetical protein